MQEDIKNRVGYLKGLLESNQEEKKESSLTLKLKDMKDRILGIEETNEIKIK